MSKQSRVLCVLMALAVTALTGVPASASSLIRSSLDQLSADNSLVVMGEVVDFESYWNEAGDFILTDVRIRPLQVVKGKILEQELTITLMGGTVGETTTLIIGGPEFVPGSSYVLFLNREDLPGAAQALTVRDHCQGVFDIVLAGDQLRAISQANNFSLVPDRLGYFDAAGGAEGYPLNAMFDTVRQNDALAVQETELNPEK